MEYVDRGKLPSIHQAARRARSQYVHDLLRRFAVRVQGVLAAHAAVGTPRGQGKPRPAHPCCAQT